MKKHLLYLCTIGISLFLTSCIAGIERDISISSGEDAEISVEQARKFFEQELLTRNDDTPSPNILSPGDFTPQWNNAQISQNYRIACVDVPIIPTYRYRAIRSEFRRGQAQAYIVNVSQKVVIVKDRESGAMASYVMSLIPDKDFAAKHKGDISDLFLNANDRGRFSGMIVYTYHNTPIRLSKYVAGKRVEGISTCGVEDIQQYKERLRKIYYDLSGIKVYKSSYITSRSEWDGYEIDDEESDNKNTIGSGSEGENGGGSGGNTGGDSGEDRIIGIDEVIIIGHGPNDTIIGARDPQPDPENPENPKPGGNTEEGDIGNDGDNGSGSNGNNTGNTDNSAYEKVIADMASKISNETLKKLMQENTNVQFIVNKTVDLFKINFTIKTSGSNTTINIKDIQYNPQEVKSLNKTGIVIAILHEFMHPYLGKIGQSGTDAEDHQKFVKDGVYMNTIRELFPNEDDDFYNVVVYAGCADCKDFNQLSFERQDYITRQLDNYFYD